jgi:hypothetical protein
MISPPYFPSKKGEKRMKKMFTVLFAVLAIAGAEADAQIIIQRAESKINAGFKERVYIDGKQKATLTNGETATLIVPAGQHTIYAELYTLTTDKVSFYASSSVIYFTITPYSMSNFVIEQAGVGFSGGGSFGGNSTPATPPPPPKPSAKVSTGVEGSLERAAEKVMLRIPVKAKVAIVYVSSDDEDLTEFIANEVEFIFVENGITVIDRSQLDKIRKEQRFQLSGEVDDDEAVSIGKIAGASVILTGAVTGRGDLRRLRLRALDTQTAQVLVAASEKF